jgi:formyl-CoA transferase
MSTPPVLHRAPPALGEHTDEVLAELGLDARQVAGLRQRGVV